MTTGVRTEATLRPTCRVCAAPLVPDQRYCGECGVDLTLDRDLPLGDEEAKPAADPLVGRTLADRYRILRCIGRGGMGVVYEVEHVHIGKRLAMKLLHGELAGDPVTLRRLRREAETASRLSDSGTVQVFDFGESNGLAYLVMELVDGEDYGHVLRREGKLPFARVAQLLLDVCGSLGEAHAVGVVHRDLKPENIMIARSSSGTRAKVLDFGLAVLRAAPNESVARPGSIVGTPYYMAPEQIRGEEVDGRTDVYALGGVMYRSVVGVPPFTGDSAIVVLTQHLTDSPTPPSRAGADVDEAADRIILRCLAKRPADRYATAGQLRDDLERWLLEHGASMSRSSLGPQRPRSEAIATRQDIDAFESRLRSRVRITAVSFAIGLLALALLAVFLGFEATRTDQAPTAEIEPNQTALTATRLMPSVDLRGQLGRRISRTEGDVDVYRLVVPHGAPRGLRASVTALPNVDMVLELVRDGQREPLLAVDAHGVGEGEAFEGFPLAEGEHLLVVRGKTPEGAYPIENVSDSYVVRWEPMAITDGELDDDPAEARALAPSQPLDGRIGWPGDEDTYCVAAATRRARLTVAVDVGLDLEMAWIDAAPSEPTLVDAHGAGESESLEVPASTAGRTCLRIAASRRATTPVPVPGSSSYHLLLVQAPP